MGSDVADILGRVHQLSVSDLLAVQEAIIGELRQKVVGGTGTHISLPSTQIAPDKRHIPGLHYRTPEEIEAELATMFTPEQLAEIAQTDITNLPHDPKTMTEYSQENREDRIV